MNKERYEEQKWIEELFQKEREKVKYRPEGTTPIRKTGYPQIMYSLKGDTTMIHDTSSNGVERRRYSKQQATIRPTNARIILSTILMVVWGTAIIGILVYTIYGAFNNENNQTQLQYEKSLDIKEGNQQ